MREKKFFLGKILSNSEHVEVTEVKETKYCPECKKNTTFSNVCYEPFGKNIKVIDECDECGYIDNRNKFDVEWVGLTMEEKQAIVDSIDGMPRTGGWHLKLFNKIEAELKRKNAKIKEK